MSAKTKVTVVTPKEAKHVTRRKGDGRSGKDSQHMTMMVTISADGNHIKEPYVIMSCKEFPVSCAPLAHRCCWGGSGAGWITDKNFEAYIQNSLVPHIEEKRKAHNKPPSHHALLLTDGHVSRRSAIALRHLHEHHIDCETIPAHSSHVTQPLDVLIFALFKQTMNKHRRALVGVDVPTRRYLLLKYALISLYHAVEEDTVKSSFHRDQESAIASHINPTSLQFLASVLGNLTKES